MSERPVVLHSLSAAMDGGFTAIHDVSSAMSAVGAQGDYRLIGGVSVMLHVQRLEQRAVLVGGARIGCEIFIGAELQRIHEDAHHDPVRQLQRVLHQRAVACMQVAHRRHESDALPAPPPLDHLPPQLRRARDDLHAPVGAARDCFRSSAQGPDTCLT